MKTFKTTGFTKTSIIIDTINCEVQIQHVNTVTRLQVNRRLQVKNFSTLSKLMARWGYECEVAGEFYCYSKQTVG